jgi:cbb3-type cytochrome c oxidase subunit I
MEGTIEPSPQLVNIRLVRTWLYWSLAWLTVFPLVGLLVSIKFHNPGFLGTESWFTFGRLRPVHVNGVIFGAFSTPFLGLLYYLIPRLAGRPMAGMAFSRWALWGWQIFIVTGTLSFLFGYNLGFEADEFQWPWNILRFVVLTVIGSQVLVTLFKRKEGGFYVALWYAVAALVWTLMNLILGNVILPYVPMSGISNAALHGLYIHYVVGLWITPAGLALMYYFIPLACKNPLFSHALSKFGFWTIALLYPFLGTHHYLFSPIPYHNQTISIVTSMLLIIPVWAVVTNHFGTALGRWGAIVHGTDADSYGAKFLLLAVFFYLVGCFQGSTEALRRVQELTHFSDFVIAHSHFTVFGTFVVAAVGSMYFVWPRLTGRKLWSARMASWHLWLTVAGASVMLLGLTAQGFIQGSMLEYGANFVDTVVEMKPWWVARTLAGATMDIGFMLMVINFIQTARHGAPFKETPYGEALQTRPAGEERRIISTPSGVVLIAGITYFLVAVVIQGIWPSLLPETNTPDVTDAETGLTIKATDYTPLQRRGRQVYIREGCWYCHSQYIRPVTGETSRWGPLSQAGEYVYDQPHLLSTRRIGPDLFRVGRKYSDGWHAAHHWNPRQIVPDSIMPRFPWLFKPVHGDETPRLNDDGKALVAYLQKLGTNIGDWRETFTPPRLISGAALQLSKRDKKALIPKGKRVYERRCIGCHGAKGDGKGPAARFFKTKPRDFTSGIFKFRSTGGGAKSLPSDQDLFITITHGLWGTPMPPWYKISSDERMAVIQYIKTFSGRWHKEPVNPPIDIPPEPPVTAASIARGQKHFNTICFTCHGKDGKGDGPLAGSLTDAWGHAVRPANFTLPAGTPGGVKLGHDGTHIFKTIMTGVGGPPMPPFADTFKPNEVWDIVHFVQSLRVTAHVHEMRITGLKRDKLNVARHRIWGSLSQAAADGHIGGAVVTGNYQAGPAKAQVAAAATTQPEGIPRHDITH